MNILIKAIKLPFDLLACCGGVPYRLLNRVADADLYKYRCLGILIICISLWGFLAASYAGYLVIENYQIAALLGILWATIVMTVDRALIIQLSGGKQGIIGRTFSILIRIALAILIAVIIAQPIKLKIFDDVLIEYENIIRTIESAKLTEAKLEYNRQLEEKLQQTLAIKSERDNEISQTLTRYRNQIDALNRQLIDIEKKKTGAFLLWECEQKTTGKQTQCNFDILALQIQADANFKDGKILGGSCQTRCLHYQALYEQFEREETRLKNDIEKYRAEERKITASYDSTVKPIEQTQAVVDAAINDTETIIGEQKSRFTLKSLYLRQILSGDVDRFADEPVLQAFINKWQKPLALQSFWITIGFIIFEIFPILLKVMWRRNSLDVIIDEVYNRDYASIKAHHERQQVIDQNHNNVMVDALTLHQKMTRKEFSDIDDLESLNARWDQYAAEREKIMQSVKPDNTSN